MSTDHTISAVKLIAEPLLEFPPPQSHENLTVTIPHAGGSTAQWAKNMLQTVKLKKNPWNWMKMPIYTLYRQKLQKTRAVQACVPPPTTDRPETEADVIAALDTQLLSVVHRVTQSWLPPESSVQAAPAQQWKLVVVSEAYIKPSPGQVEPGVRIDKLVSVKTKWNANRIATRSVTQSQRSLKDPNVQSAHQYLPRGSIWGRQPAASDLGHKKGLVAVEVKKLGLLRPRDMQKLASEDKHLGLGHTDGTAGGMRAILQQAIRYAYHYGTEFAYITDYQTGILLSVPDIKRDVTEVGGKIVRRNNMSVEWAVVDIREARNALAFLVFSACDRMRDAIAPS